MVHYRVDSSKKLNIIIYILTSIKYDWGTVLTHLLFFDITIFKIIVY